MNLQNLTKTNPTTKKFWNKFYYYLFCVHLMPKRNLNKTNYNMNKLKDL